MRRKPQEFMKSRGDALSCPVFNAGQIFPVRKILPTKTIVSENQMGRGF